MRLATPRVFADMLLDGRPWDLCPRTFLKRQVRLAADAGFDVMAAFENEFYLVRPTPGGFEPVDETVFAAALAMDRIRTVVDELADALIEQGIPVELYYPESGPGQQELSTRYCSALTAADRQLAYRETTDAVARRHGLRATFVPKPFEGKAGSGCHRHLSLWRDGRNLFPDPTGAGGLSPLGRSFLAGILTHLAGLVAVVAPSTNSYRRLKPAAWSGGFRFGSAVREAAALFPGTDAEPSRLNVLLSDGNTLAAARWVHTLHLLDERVPGLVDPRGPSEPSLPFRAACVASEPIGSADWQLIPDHSLLIVGGDLGYALAPLG